MNINKLFAQRAKNYFGEEGEKFLKLLDEPSKHGFFINTNKDIKDNILNKISFSYEKSGMNENSFFTDYSEIGKSPEYNLGLIYPQDPESALSSSLIKDKDFSLIVDLCAAPGGKSVNIGCTYPKSLLVSNEVNHLRAGILASNLERMGFDRSIVTNMEIGYLKDKLKGMADLVILDAPCSGEGMIRKYSEIMDNYSLDNILSLAKTQKELLENAYEICKKDGYILYSTCTYAMEEDENQIEDFIESHDAKLIPLSFKDNYSKMPGTIKLCPLNGTEGQFMALIQKNADTGNTKFKYLKETESKIVRDFISGNLEIDRYYLYANNGQYYMSLEPLPDLGKGVIRYGIYLGEVKKNRFEPSHSFYRANSLIGKYKHVINLDAQEYADYVKGLELAENKPDGYYLVTYMNYQLGYGKIASGRLKNKYPKGLRSML